MIQNSFIHIDGIGVGIEKQIWRSGIRTWDDALAEGLSFLDANLQSRAADELAESRERFARRDALYFSSRFPAGEQWRLFPDFRDSIAYFDIETTGLSREQNMITTIALYDGKRISHYVNGHNLVDFAHDIFDYDVLVTFNGKSFDVPFIEAFFGITLRRAHIDLRYVLKQLGYTGGLKRCERQLGIDRGNLRDVDGAVAVKLWKEYRKNGNDRALDTLLAYNIEDVVNLETLLITAFNERAAATPFRDRLMIDDPLQPDNPCTVDGETLDLVLGASF
jgi:uncharacterized protein